MTHSGRAFPLWFLMAEKFIQILEVYNEAGVRGFWNGVIPTLIMVRDD